MIDQRATMVAMLVTGVIVFNFIPSMIAYATRHPERRRLATLNVMSFLSFLLWTALLVWAIGGKRDDSVVGRFVADGRRRGWLTGAIIALLAAGLATTAYALVWS